MQFNTNFSNQQQSENHVQYIKKRQKLKHQNLAQLKYVKFEQIQHWCSSFYQVTTQYEYFPNNLKKETLKLKRSGNKLSAINMIRMIYDCIDVLALLEENDFQISEIHPTLLFLQKDEIEDLFQIKFCERISGSDNPQTNKVNSLTNNLDLYLSPEDFELLFQGKNSTIQKDFRSEVFVIGLCFLEAGIQESIQDIYNLIQGKFKIENLHQHIRRFDKIYDNEPFLQALIQKMLEVNERQRPSFQELKDNLPQWFEIQKVLMDNQFEQEQQKNYQNLDNLQKSNYQQNVPSYLPKIQNQNNQLYTQFDPQSQKFVVSNQDNNLNYKNSIQIPDNKIENFENQQNQSQDMHLFNQHQRVLSNTHQYDSNNQFQNFNLDMYKSKTSDNSYPKENHVSIENIQEKFKPVQNQFQYQVYDNEQKSPRKVFKHLTFQQFSSQNSNKFPKKNEFPTPMPIHEQNNVVTQSKERFQVNSQPVLVDSQQLHSSNNYEQAKLQKANPLYVQSQKNDFDYKKLDLKKITQNMKSSKDFYTSHQQDNNVQVSNQTKEQYTTKTQNINPSYNSLLSKDKQGPERPHLRYYEKFFDRVPKIKLHQSLKDKYQQFLYQYQQKQIMEQKQREEYIKNQQNNIQQAEKINQNIKQKNQFQNFQHNDLDFQQQHDNKSGTFNSKQVQGFDIFTHNKKQSENNNLKIDNSPKMKKASKKEIQTQDNYFTRQKEYTDIVHQQSNFFSLENSYLGNKQKEKQSMFSLKQQTNQQGSLIGFNENEDYFQQYSTQKNKNPENIQYDGFQYNNQDKDQFQNQQITLNYNQNQKNSPKNDNNNTSMTQQRKFQSIYDLLEQNEGNFGLLPSQEDGNFQMVNQNMSDDLIGFKEQNSEDYNPYINNIQSQKFDQNNTFPEKSLALNQVKLLSNQDIQTNQYMPNKFFNLNDSNTMNF